MATKKNPSWRKTVKKAKKDYGDSLVESYLKKDLKLRKRLSKTKPGSPERRKLLGLQNPKNPTTYGTSYFATKSSAIRYYKPYGDDAKSVEQKIKEGAIHIGQPPHGPGDKLKLIDGGTRWQITKANPAKKPITIKFSVPTMADAKRVIKKLGFGK